jgi:hypothetical protein
MSIHKEWLCCYEGCAGIICLTPAQEERMRRTHEDFRCPFGHIQGFYGKSKEEKKIEQLENQIRAKNSLLQYRAETIEELRHELRSVRARLGAKTRRLRSVA